MFGKEVGDLSVEVLSSIKMARTVGWLLVYGITRRLLDEPEVMPICGDEMGRYKQYWDDFLLNLSSSFG